MHNAAMDTMTRALARLAAIALLALLAACGGSAKRSPLEQSLYTYSSTIRWSEFDKALAFVDPEAPAMEPLALERLQQYQVSGYDVRSSEQVSDTEYTQVVELRVVNRHTQAERTVTDRQRWRWDAEAKRWWLASGLPDLSPR